MAKMEDGVEAQVLKSDEKDVPDTDEEPIEKGVAVGLKVIDDDEEINSGARTGVKRTLDEANKDEEEEGIKQMTTLIVSLEYCHTHDCRFQVLPPRQKMLKKWTPKIMWRPKRPV